MAKYRKLGRTSAQRKALLRNQVTAVINNGKIVTTEAKAKEVQKIVDGLIALAVKEKDNFETVKVTTKVARKDKGKTGKVLQTSPKEGKVIVEGLNMVTKHVKPRRQGEQGGIVKAEGAIYACKVMPVCPKCGKATRVGHSVKDGKTVRVCRKCGAEL